MKECYSAADLSNRLCYLWLLATSVIETVNASSTCEATSNVQVCFTVKVERSPQYCAHCCSFIPKLNNATHLYMTKGFSHGIIFSSWISVDNWHC